MSMNFFLLINAEMPTIVGISTFKSRKNSILGLSEPEKYLISWYLYTYKHLKFHAQMSWAWKKCYNPGPWLCYVLIVYSVCLQNVMDHKALPQECCESPVNVLATLDQSKGEDQEKNMPG